MFSCVTAFGDDVVHSKSAGRAGVDTATRACVEAPASGGSLEDVSTCRMRRQPRTKSGVAAAVAGRWAQRRLAFPGGEKTNTLGKHLGTGNGRDRKDTGGQSRVGAWARMIAGRTKVRAIWIASEVHHAALVDLMAVVPDVRFVMAALGRQTVVVIGFERGQLLAGVVMVAVSGVFRWRGRVKAGDLVIMIILVLVLVCGERGMIVWRRDIECDKRRRLLQRQVVMRGSHDG